MFSLFFTEHFHEPADLLSTIFLAISLTGAVVSVALRKDLTLSETSRWSVRGATLYGIGAVLTLSAAMRGLPGLPEDSDICYRRALLVTCGVSAVNIFPDFFKRNVRTWVHRSQSIGFSISCGVLMYFSVRPVEDLLENLHDKLPLYFDLSVLFTGLLLGAFGSGAGLVRSFVKKASLDEERESLVASSQTSIANLDGEEESPFT